jgi:hypothetical protein
MALATREPGADLMGGTNQTAAANPIHLERPRVDSRKTELIANRVWRICGQLELTAARLSIGQNRVPPALEI